MEVVDRQPHLHRRQEHRNVDQNCENPREIPLENALYHVELGIYPKTRLRTENIEGVGL
jgi:hypothetical protein